MLNTIKNNYKLLIVCAIAFALIYFLLRLLISNEGVLNIAQFSSSLVIFLFGFIYNDKSSKREVIKNKLEQYQTISNAISDLQKALNIKTKQLTFLHSLNPEMDFNSTVQAISDTVTEIENATIQYNIISPLILDSASKENFEDCVITLTSTFKTVLLGLQDIVSKWGDVIARSSHAKQSAEMLNSDDNKLHYVALSYNQINKMESEKKRLLGVYDSQESKLDALLSELNKSAQQVLDDEYSTIKKLENEI